MSENDSDQETAEFSASKENLPVIADVLREDESSELPPKKDLKTRVAEAALVLARMAEIDPDEFETLQDLTRLHDFSQALGDMSSYLVLNPGTDGSLMDMGWGISVSWERRREDLQEAYEKSNFFKQYHHPFRYSPDRKQLIVWAIRSEGKEMIGETTPEKVSFGRFGQSADSLSYVLRSNDPTYIGPLLIEGRANQREFIIMSSIPDAPPGIFLDGVVGHGKKHIADTMHLVAGSVKNASMLLVERYHALKEQQSDNSEENNLLEPPIG